jgi:hypothetical protein
MKKGFIFVFCKDKKKLCTRFVDKILIKVLGEINVSHCTVHPLYYIDFFRNHPQPTKEEDKAELRHFKVQKTMERVLRFYSNNHTEEDCIIIDNYFADDVGFLVSQLRVRNKPITHLIQLGESFVHAFKDHFIFPADLVPNQGKGEFNQKREYFESSLKEYLRTPRGPFSVNIFDPANHFICLLNNREVKRFLLKLPCFNAVCRVKDSSRLFLLFLFKRSCYLADVRNLDVFIVNPVDDKLRFLLHSKAFFLRNVRETQHTVSDAQGQGQKIRFDYLGQYGITSGEKNKESNSIYYENKRFCFF